MNPIAFEKRKKLLQTKLVEILHREFDNPRLNSISITRIEADPGMESVRFFFTSFMTQYPPEQFEKELNGLAKIIRYKLTKALKTRSTPLPRFIYDRGLDNIGKIDRILKELKS